MKTIAIHWFRQDLRLTDNTALSRASLANETIPIYIFDDNYPIGDASRLWLHNSLVFLRDSLNNNLNFYKGNPIFVDIGRKDYLTKHLDYSLAQAHNSIMINKSGIFDGFIKKNFFTKIGIYELNKENYMVKYKKNKIEFKALLSDKSTIIRTFELQNKAIIIENEFNNMSQKNRIDIPLFIDNKIKIKKIDKTNILLSSKLFKSSLSIKGENNSLKIEIFNNKQYYKFSQCRSYGESENLNLINLSFLGKEYFKTTLKLNFLD